MSHTLKSLPVLMYHYVSRTTGAINVTPEHFEDHCRFMAALGWRGVSLAEAEAFLRDEAPLPPRCALFTFDDGFLDNAVYAAPLLQRYGHCGVVFAVTERLTAHAGHCQAPPPGPDMGPDMGAGVNLGINTDVGVDVDAVMQPHRLGYMQRQDVFLSWDDARRLDRENMAIAAHSARHLAVFASPDWSGLHIPGPRANTFYRIDSPVPWGMPRFKERPALHSRAFLPSNLLLDTVRQLVPQETEAAYAFFQNPTRAEAVLARLHTFTPEQLGRYETDAEREARVGAELELCARTLKTELGHPVHSFCWPWGGTSDLARNLAQDLGFSVFFTTQMGPNQPGSALAVNRFKARDKSGNWLGLRLHIHASPLLSRLYVACRI